MNTKEFIKLGVTLFCFSVFSLLLLFFNLNIDVVEDATEKKVLGELTSDVDVELIVTGGVTTVSTTSVPATTTHITTTYLPGTTTGYTTIHTTTVQSTTTAQTSIPAGAVDIEVQAAAIPNIDVNDDLVLDLRVFNAGNTTAAPTKLVVSIYSASGNLLVTREIYDIEGTAPSETKRLEILLSSLNLTLGEYYADIQVFENQYVIFEKRISFFVLGSTTSILPATGEKKIDLGDWGPILIIGGISFIFASGFFIIAGLKKRKKDNEDDFFQTEI